MESTKFSIDVKSFKRMNSPFLNNFSKDVFTNNLTKYVMYANIKSLDDELLEWFDTNPRYQNVDKSVSQDIKESLNERNEKFHDLNKGILFSASKVFYDNKLNKVFFYFDLKEIHGNVDGGHTLRVISKYKKENVDIKDVYVFIEIITGINNKDEIVELAGARNKSIQVDLKSLSDLQRTFDPIKDLFNELKLPFRERIIYKMNEEKNKDYPEKKDIDIREIIAILNMFNLDIYKNSMDSIQPMISYSAKESALKAFLNLEPKKDQSKKGNIENSVRKMKNIIEDIFQLYEAIEKQFPDVYNSNNRKYGAKKGIQENVKNKKNNLSRFYKSKLKYGVPISFIYPLLSGFRSLIITNPITKELGWIIDPMSVWEDQKSILVGVIADDKEFNNPNAIGKNKNIWNTIFWKIYLYKSEYKNKFVNGGKNNSFIN